MPLSKEQVWDVFLKNSPSSKNPDHQVTMTARGLKKLVDLAWDHGHEQGFANGKAYESMHGKKPEKDHIKEFIDSLGIGK